MSAASSTLPAFTFGEYVPTADARVVMFGVSWEGYEAQLTLRGDVAGPRIAYLDGAMELMSPSKGHERVKSYIGMLIETFAEERGIDLSPYGSWTLKAEAKTAGLEPDECYLVGADQARATPDLAIEVVWTSGGIDKLEAYRRLQVREVWFWQRERITTFVLDTNGTAYIESPRSGSVVLPELDIGTLVSFLSYPTAMQAVRAFRAHLQAGARGERA
jgi:Uma2 family endonuclease